MAPLLALLTGLFLFLSFPDPGMWFLAWFALVPLFFAVHRVSIRQAALLGLLSGMALHVLLLYWILIVLGTYGYLPWWLSVPALLLLSLYLSLFPALFCVVVHWGIKGSPHLGLLSAPFLWVGLDYIKGHLFTGFPWSNLAYSQYKMPLLLQAADITGHYGITFAIVLANCILFTIISCYREKTRLPLRHLIPALLILVAFMGYNLFCLHALPEKIALADKTKIGLIQGNIRQDLKWAPELQRQTVETYINLSRQALAKGDVNLLIWPETALPFYPLENPLFSSLIDETNKKQRVWLLTGAPHREQRAPGFPIDYYNSAFMISPNGQITDRYDKMHLVPFGEYVPLRDFLPFLTPLVETIGDFTVGKNSHPLSCGKAEIGVLICFEGIFPELARQNCLAGGNLLAAITNDAWFGRSSAPQQHLSMVVLRAVETRRSVARAANTGISAFIDPLGRILATTSLFTTGYITAEVPLMTEATVYVRYGDLFAKFCLITVLLLIIFTLQRRSYVTRAER